MDRTNAALWADLDREPTLLELADAMGCREADLDDDLQALHTSRMLSLDESYGDDRGSTLESQIAGALDDPGSKVLERERVERLTKALAELPETDRHVVVLYFHEQLYLKEIGNILGVTESRISQILTRALERLRLKLKEQE
jgi:RNA polymerase sigma factor for flagellar operon FliA